MLQLSNMIFFNALQPSLHMLALSMQVLIAFTVASMHPAAPAFLLFAAVIVMEKLYVIGNLMFVTVAECHVINGFESLFAQAIIGNVCVNYICSYFKFSCFPSFCLITNFKFPVCYFKCAHMSYHHLLRYLMKGIPGSTL